MNNEKHGGGMTWRERLALFGYWLVGADPDVMSQSPTIDRHHMQAKAVLLSFVGGIALFTWGAFFGIFWSWYIAAPLTLLVVGWVVLIDRALGSVHWKLHGVLATPGKRRFALNGILILRFAIAVVTASVTSYSATLAINYATIAAQEEKDRNAENAARRAAAEADKKAAWQNMLAGRDAEVKQATTDIATISGKLDAARRARDAASQTAADSKIAADCQVSGGPGCHRGKGPMYRAALTHQAKAADDLQRAESDMSSLAAQLADATRKRDDALKAYREREPEFLAAAKAIDERVAKNMVPASNDPVMASMALQKVYASPEGPAARFYSHLILMLLLTIELSYILVSEYFGHASIYVARLIARTKILGAEVADEYRRKTAALFGRDRNSDEPRMSFRVMPRVGSDDD